MNPSNPGQELIQTLEDLHKRHVAFLSKFTSEMVQYFTSMKHYYQEEQHKRKLLFESQKQQISKLVLQKKIEQQKINQKISKKQTKKQKSQRKKQQKQIKIKLNAPKPPNTPYFMFFMDYKQKIKEDFPQISVVEAAKMAGKLWKELEDNEKEVYFQMHEDSKKKYEIEIQEYKARREKFETQKNEKKRWEELMKGLEKEKVQTTQQKDFEKSEKEEEKQEKNKMHENKQINEIQTLKDVDLSLSESEAQSQIGKPLNADNVDQSDQNQKSEIPQKADIFPQSQPQKAAVDILKKLREQSKTMMEEAKLRAVRMAQLNQQKQKQPQSHLSVNQTNEEVTQSGSDESPEPQNGPQAQKKSLKCQKQLNTLNKGPSNQSNQQINDLQADSISI